MSSWGVFVNLVYGTLGVVATAIITTGIYARFNLRWLGAYLAAVNVVAFVFYGYDKLFVRLLNKLKLRVPEQILIWGLAFPGGVVGAWLAMQLFAHKTGPGSQDFRVRLRAASLILVALVVTLMVASGEGIISTTWLDDVVEFLAELVTTSVEGLLEAIGR